MKKVSTILLIVLILFSCDRGNKYPELKGNIESIKSTEYNADEKFGEPVRGDLESVTISDFDNKGWIVKETTYDEDGDKSTEREYQYKNNNLISFKMKGKYSETHQDLVRENKHEEVYLVKEVDFGRPWAESRDTVTTVDTVYIELDRNGYQAKQTRKNNDGTQSISHFIHDKKGKLLEHKWLRDGVNIRQWEKLEYDKNGLLVKTNTLYIYGDTRNDSTLYSYKLDNRSNWVERIDRENGKVSKIIEREIKYR